MSPKSSRTPATPTLSDKAEAIKARLRESLLHDRHEMEVDKIFKALVKLEGSDLHLKVGQPPPIAVDVADGATPSMSETDVPV